MDKEKSFGGFAVEHREAADIKNTDVLNINQSNLHAFIRRKSCCCSKCGTKIRKYDTLIVLICRGDAILLEDEMLDHKEERCSEVGQSVDTPSSRLLNSTTTSLTISLAL